MKKILILVSLVVVLSVAGFYILNTYIYNQKQIDSSFASDFKNTEFVIDGEQMMLGDSLQYFGNELVTDLNNDGRDDVVFLVTHSPGGSGTFFYVVAAINTEEGYVGSDGYLLGDRIAPQTTELSLNSNHKNVIVVNYVDRADDEPMSASPSVGKSAYLKLDSAYMQWGVVEPDFEGESNLPILGDPIAVRGEIACLPKQTTGPQTLECAIGLKVGDNGGFYALKNLFEHDPNYTLSQTGTPLEVIGSVVQEDMYGPDGNQYDIMGAITITSVEKI